jgi:5-methylcytosine-specific restriction protein A
MATPCSHVAATPWLHGYTLAGSRRRVVYLLDYVWGGDTLRSWPGRGANGNGSRSAVTPRSPLVSSGSGAGWAGSTRGGADARPSTSRTPTPTSGSSSRTRTGRWTRPRSRTGTSATGAGRRSPQAPHLEATPKIALRGPQRPEWRPHDGQARSSSRLTAEEHRTRFPLRFIREQPSPLREKSAPGRTHQRPKGPGRSQMSRRTRCIDSRCLNDALPGTSRCPEHTGTSGWAKYIADHPERAAFYRSGGWTAARRRHLAANPSCVLCGAPAVAVDHIRPRAEGGAGLDPSNLQSLCERCHQAKTVEESHRGRRRR